MWPAALALIAIDHEVRGQKIHVTRHQPGDAAVLDDFQTAGFEIAKVDVIDFVAGGSAPAAVPLDLIAVDIYEFRAADARNDVHGAGFRGDGIDPRAQFSPQCRFVRNRAC